MGFLTIWLVSGLIGLLLLMNTDDFMPVSLKKTPLVCGCLVIIGAFSIITAAGFRVAKEFEAMDD